MPHKSSAQIVFVGHKAFDASTAADRVATEPQQEAVLEFARHWYAGAEHFTLQTSGSTGTPKPLLVERWQLEASAQMTAQALGLQPDTVALLCLDARFVAGTLMMVRAFELGMTLWVTTPKANPLEGWPEDQPLDFMAVVPYQLENMVLQSPDQLEDVGCVIVGGAAVSKSLQARIKGLRVPIFATYGMTETLSHIALQRLNGSGAAERFKPLPGVQLSTDERGCLVIQAPHLTGAIVTNDCVELKDDQTFRVLGRTDFVINSGGIKIHPETDEQTVQRCLESMRIARRCYLFGRPDEALGEVAVLALEGQPLTNHEAEQLMSKLKTALPQYHVPKTLVYIARFEETATGKIIRKKL